MQQRQIKQSQIKQRQKKQRADNKLIKDKLRQIPNLPGIYKMLDSRGIIIYIGKSKCLRKRVQSYFVSSPKWEKVNRMVSLISDIEYIVTDTHLEARLLECRLIKEYKPHFNAQMKNDQRYFYIKVEHYNKYHVLSVEDERSEDCFGPFRSRYTISEFLRSLKNIYPITKNAIGYDFEYHMFPVAMKEELFERNREIFLELFSQEDRILILIEAFQAKLMEAALAYRYEIASVYRDMINCFEIIKNGLDGYKALATRNILLKLPTNPGYKLFFVSNGNIIHSQLTEQLSKEIITAFIMECRLKISAFPSETSSEKTRLDYWDILYSEISDLSEDMIEFL